MLRRLSPVEAALKDYEDGTSIIVGRPKFVPIPTDVHEEVEIEAALAYAESRAHAQGCTQNGVFM